MKRVDEQGERRDLAEAVTLDRDEGNRADDRPGGARGVEAGDARGQSVKKAVHHRRQRQPAFRRRLRLRPDGAKEAESAGSQPLGVYRGFAVAGCEPDEMGIGPVFAVPKLLERTVSRSTISISGN